MWQIGKERNDFFFEEQIWWWITCLDCLFFKVLSAEPNEIHMLATSWTVILLSSSKTTVTWSTLWPILCVSGYPAHRNLQQTSHHFLTSKTIIWLFHCLLYRGYFQHFKSPGTVFPQFRQNLMHTLFFQACHFPCIPKLQMEQHIHILSKSSLNNHTCYIIT